MRAGSCSYPPLHSASDQSAGFSPVSSSHPGGCWLRAPVPDYDAVRNGLTPPGNSGVVEATVDTIILMIKRQMYGRAGFPLRKRVLVAT